MTCAHAERLQARRDEERIVQAETADLPGPGQPGQRRHGDERAALGPSSRRPQHRHAAALALRPPWAPEWPVSQRHQHDDDERRGEPLVLGQARRDRAQPRDHERLRALRQDEPPDDRRGGRGGPEQVSIAIDARPPGHRETDDGDGPAGEDRQGVRHHAGPPRRQRDTSGENTEGDRVQVLRHVDGHVEVTAAQVSEGQRARSGHQRRVVRVRELVDRVAQRGEELVVPARDHQGVRQPDRVRIPAPDQLPPQTQQRVGQRAQHDDDGHQ